MKVIRVLLARIAGLVARNDSGDEFREEMEAHLDMETAEYVRRGMTGLPVTLTLRPGGFHACVYVVHIAAGAIGLVSEYVVISVAKGGQMHRQSGRVLMYAMATMGFSMTLIRNVAVATGSELLRALH